MGEEVMKALTSGCQSSSIPLTGSVRGVSRLLLPASFCAPPGALFSAPASFFFLLAPKQPRLSPETKVTHVLN